MSVFRSPSAEATPGVGGGGAAMGAGGGAAAMPSRSTRSIRCELLLRKSTQRGRMATISPASGITSPSQYEPERLVCELDTVAEDMSSLDATAVARSTSGRLVAGGWSGSSGAIGPPMGSGLGGSQARQK